MKALNDYLKTEGILQSELARRLKVSQGQLWHWMRGTRRPRIDALKRMSKETGISLEKLARDL